MFKLKENRIYDTMLINKFDQVRTGLITVDSVKYFLYWDFRESRHEKSIITLFLPSQVDYNILSSYSNINYQKTFDILISENSSR